MLPLGVLLRNHVGEGSKKVIQAAWSTPIHHVKWWISCFRSAYRTQAAFKVELFMTLAAFGLLYVTESLVFGAVRVLHVFRHFIIIIIIIIVIIINTIIVVIITLISIIVITFIIKLLGFLIKDSLLFRWGKLKICFCLLQFLHMS